MAAPPLYEPIETLLQHAVWLVRHWAPDESEFYAVEALWLVEQLAPLLEERDNVRRAACWHLKRRPAAR
jgi:hypothetical protein